MKTYRSVCMLAILWMIGGMVSALWAQSGSGIIFGTVTIRRPCMVSTAVITATNVATGTVEKANADQSGNYVIADLPAATYSITCTANGFQTIERTGILLQVDQRARVDLPMPRRTNPAVVRSRRMLPMLTHPVRR